MREARTCAVCEEATSKYKCPQCRTPYCKVECYQTHKSSDTCIAVSKSNPPPQLSAPHSQSTETQPNEKECESVVTIDQFTKLRNVKWLQSELNNTQLCRYLFQINNSTDPNATLKESLKVPQVADFLYGALDEISAE